MTTLLPRFLPIPARTAQLLHFACDAVTARDISYAIASAWLAVRTPSWHRDDWYRIPDNRLRAALGMGRRDRIEVEQARYERMAANTIRFHGEAIPMPHPKFVRLGDGTEIPDRNNLDDELVWQIDQRLVDAFTVRGSEPVIYLPLQLIQGARLSYTTPFIMRMLAYKALGHRAEFSRHEAHIGVRLRMDDLTMGMDLPAVAPSKLMTDYLARIVDEVERVSRMHLTIDPEYTTALAPRRPGASPRRPPATRRAIHSFIVFLALPQETEAERQARMYAEHERERDTRKGWRKPVTGPKRKEPRPPPADVSNVTLLPSAPAPRFGGFTLSSRSPGVQSAKPSVDVDPDGDIPF